MTTDEARDNLTALAQAEARRARTPGIRRWFIVLPLPEQERRRTRRIRVPIMPMM